MDDRTAATKPPVRLKVLLRERHWQTYRTFNAEYDKAARKVDPGLVGAGPSRAQLHRWTSGDVKGLPYPDHCRVLEKMFPGWAAAQLFEPVTDAGPEGFPSGGESAAAEKAADLLTTIDQRLTAPQGDVQWGSRRTSAASVSSAMPHSVEGASDTARSLGRHLLELQRVLRLSDEEAAELAGLSGNVIELSLSIDIDIDPQGWSKVTYRHHLFNLCDKPLTRLAREVWFKSPHDRLIIEPISDPDRRVMIQRRHDTVSLSQFACQISPPVQPGQSAMIGCRCQGGQFGKDHFWRSKIPRYTRQYTLRVRHCGAGQLVRCQAIEEQPNGSENSAEDDLVWDHDGDDVVITLTRAHLRPGQAITLRWDIPHATA